MPLDALLNIGANVTAAEQEINRLFARSEAKFANLGRNLGRSTLPLGRITGDFDQFEKSLDAANARVLAFGASAGLILGVQRAFAALVRETIQVEKALTDINVILGASTQNLTKFGSQLFSIAKNTGQAFSVVAEAATELSRQGLSMEETLKRTNSALILSRLSGLDAAESVKTLTAALNSFTREALNHEQIVNKLANVDAKFAVSTADLASAISRVGSTAQEANVSLDELLGIVTATQQITSRGGAVIGNALKSIFTRISRPEVIEQLQELGVQINNSQDGLARLRALANALADAGPAQASAIKELAGGVYQINVVSAALSDLRSNYSITTRAIRESTTATNEAIQRNEQLNQTYAALVNTTKLNIQEVSTQLGKLTVGPVLEKVLGSINTLLEGAISKNADSFGEILGKGLLKGLGEFLSGPGLAIVTYGIVKLVGRLVAEAGSAFKSIIGLNEAAKNRAILEHQINRIIAQQPDLLKLAQIGELGVLEAVRRVNAELIKQKELMAAQSQLTNRVIAIRTGGGKGRAEGFIPEVEEKLGAYAAGYTPGEVKTINIPKLGQVYYNTAETIRKFPQFEQPAILPPQASRAGQNYKKEFVATHGFNPYKAEGHIPNYAIIQAYHGTTSPNDFSIFRKTDDFGFHFGTKRAANENLLRKIGLLISDKPLKSFDPSILNLEASEGVRIYPVKLNINKPLRLNDIGDWSVPGNLLKELRDVKAITSKEYKYLTNLYPGYKLNYPASFSELSPIRRLLRKKGYDSFVYSNEDEHKGADSYMVFYPNQIKSIFNPNPDYSKRDIYKNEGLIPNYARSLKTIPLSSPYSPLNNFSTHLENLRAITNIFDKNKFLFDLAKQGQIRLLGAGSSRSVFDIGDNLVIKLARSDRNYSNPLLNLKRGIAQNRVEANPVLDEYRDIVPLVKEIAPDYSYLISEKAKPFNYEIFKEATGLQSAGSLVNFAKGVSSNLTGYLQKYKFLQRFNRLYTDPRLQLLPDVNIDNIGLGLRGGKLSPLIIDIGFNRDVRDRLYSNKGLIPNFNQPSIFQFLQRRNVAIEQIGSQANLFTNTDKIRALLKNDTSGMGREVLNAALTNRVLGKQIGKYDKELLKHYGINDSLLDVLSESFSNQTSYLRKKISEGEFDFSRGLIPNYAAADDLLKHLKLHKYPNVDFRVQKLSPEEVYLATLEALKKGQGSGTQFMSNLTTLADHYKVNLSLTPSAFGKGGLPQDKLIEFYKKFGFKENVTIGDELAEMIRSHAAQGLIPNFNALSEAILRENKAGVPLTQIRVDSAPQLKNNLNPFGFGVYNLRDEPAGLHQGINRAIREGADPKTYGVPNFASEPLQFTRILPANLRAQAERSAEILYGSIRKGTIAFDEIPKTVRRFAQIFQVEEKALLASVQKIRASRELIPSAFQAASRRIKEIQEQSARPPSPIPASRALVRTGLQRITPFEASLLQAGAINIEPKAQPKLLPAPNTGFIIIPSDKGFRGNLLTDRRIGGLLEQGRVFEGQPIPPPFRIPPSFFNFSARNNITPGFLRESQVLREFERLQRLGSSPFLLGAKFPEIKPSFGTRISNLINNPSFQNRAMFGSFLLPTLAGPIAQSIGDQNTSQRGVGQSVTSFANVASYGLLGSSFGVPGAVAGLGFGAALEIPRVFNAFTDKLPDLQREFEKLTEKINRTNDGFSGLIQSNEQLAAYQRGELNLTPQQFGNLRLTRNQQIDQLAISYPELAGQIRQAGRSENIQEIERVASLISFQNQKTARQESLNILSERLAPRLFGARPKEEDFKQFGQFVATNPSLDINKAGTLFDFLLEDLESNKGGSLVNRFSSVLENTQNARKRLSEIPIPVGGGRFGIINPQQERNFQEISQLQQSILAQRPQAIAFLAELGKASGRDFSKEIEILRQQNDPVKIAQLIESAFTSINFDAIREAAGRPEQEKTFAKDTSELLKSFLNLRNEVDLFKGRLEILNNTTLADITRTLNLNLSDIRTNAAIRADRVSYSPLTALNIERAGRVSEIDFEAAANEQRLRENFQTSRRAGAASLISNIQDTIYKQIGEGAQARELFPLYEQQMNAIFNRILPNFSRPNILERTGTGLVDIAKQLLPSYGNQIDRIVGKIAPTAGNIADSLFKDPQGKTGTQFQDYNTAINNLLQFGTPEDIDQFYKNLAVERDKLLSDISTGNYSGTSQKVLSSLAETFSNIIKDQTLEAEKFKAQLDDIRKNADNAKQLLENESRERRAKIIESVVGAYSGLVNDLSSLRQSAIQGLEEIDTQGLGPLAAGRRLNFRNTRALLNQGRQLYGTGQLSTTQFRQNYLIPAADAELDETGQLQGQTLRELFASNFRYNQRDFFGQIKEDVLDLGNTMRSEFSSAFESFVNGSKTAGDAARQLGIAIATNILNKVANIGLNFLIGGLTNLGQQAVSSFASRSKGGLIGYASGGYVMGGSGIRDDIPAVLPQGSFVLQKSAVNKYGTSLLDKLNYGGLVGFADGGGVDVKLQNTFDFTGRGTRLKGSFNVDPKLSVIGQTDENNPQNILKFAREQDYISYLKTIQQYKAAVRQFEAAQNQRIIGAAISAVSTVGGTYLGQIGQGGLSQGQQAAFAAGQGPVSRQYGNEFQNQTSLSNNQYNFSQYGSTTSFSNYGNQYNPYATSYFFRNRGGIIGFAGGGSVDNIPALLTGGEYVMNKSSVQRYGVDFMEKLNQGRVSNIARFAEGGLVGNDINTINPVVQDSTNEGWKQIVSVLNKQAKTLETVRDLLDNSRNTNQPNRTKTDTSNAIVPNITIQINMQDSKVASQSSQDDGTNDKETSENIKQFAEMMKNVAIETIVTQQRPGGLLDSTRKQ